MFVYEVNSVCSHDVAYALSEPPYLVRKGAHSSFSVFWDFDEILILKAFPCVLINNHFTEVLVCPLVHLEDFVGVPQSAR